MTKSIVDVTGSLVCICVGLALLCVAAVQNSYAQDVQVAPLTMAPHKIIINAKGQSDSFQGVLNMAMPSGLTISSRNRPA